MPLDQTLLARRIRAADEYLAARTGCYAFRCRRYFAATGAMRDNMGGLPNLLVDVGAGATELDIFLRDYKWRGRYVPVDAWIDGTDLDHWVPPRNADIFVALEVLEHLRDPMRLLRAMLIAADRGVIVSVPNPETTDVLGMDPTHRTVVTREMLEGEGLKVEPRSFYGKPDDSLFGWARCR